MTTHSNTTCPKWKIEVGSAAGYDRQPADLHTGRNAFKSCMTLGLYEILFLLKVYKLWLQEMQTKTGVLNLNFQTHGLHNY
jgi:hypothetical protein